MFLNLRKLLFSLRYFVLLIVILVMSISSVGQVFASAFRSMASTGFVTQNNLDGYCQAKFNGGVSAPLDPQKNAYSLYCITQLGDHVGFNMTDVCTWINGKSSVDRIVDFHESHFLAVLSR